jgi:hypothetical protein
MGGFDTGMFNLISTVFPILFIVALGVFVVRFVKGIGQWSKNNAAPVVPAEARMVAKRSASVTLRTPATWTPRTA